MICQVHTFFSLERRAAQCVSVTLCTQIKTSLVHVRIRHLAVLLLTAGPLIPWSHDAPSQITVAQQHPPTPPTHPHPPTIPLPLAPSPVLMPLAAMPQADGLLKEKQRLFLEARGKRLELTCHARIKPSFPPSFSSISPPQFSPPALSYSERAELR